MIDSLGTPFSAGGLNQPLRDAARCQTRCTGPVAGEQVIPALLSPRSAAG